MAAVGVRNPNADDFVPRWLAAVERRARALAGGRIISPPPKLRRQVELAGGCLVGQDDDPADWLAAIEAVDDRLGGAGQGLDTRQIQQAIDEPRTTTTSEIAKALGKSSRQARRIRRRLEQLGQVQGDLFTVEVVV